MGNQPAKPGQKKISNANEQKSAKEVEFDEMEMGLIDQIFHEMAVRSPNDTISKDTFMTFFDLPGVLGDRLFQVFDTKKTGEIDFEEFLMGYHKFARQDPKSKMEMMFQLFDLDGKGGITKEELRTVLLSIVTPPNQVMKDTIPGFGHRSSNLIPAMRNVVSAVDKNSNNVPLTPNQTSNSVSKGNSPKFEALGGNGGNNGSNESNDSGNDYNNNNDNNNKARNTLHGATNSTDQGLSIKPQFNLSASQGIGSNENVGHNASVMSLPGYHDTINEEPINIDEIQQKVEEIVEQAFKECDTDASGRLDPAQFKEFIKKNPEIIQVCEELFIQLAWNGPQRDTVRQDFNMIKAELGSGRYDKVAQSPFGSQDFAPNWTQCEEKECKFRFVTRREMIPPPGDDDEQKWSYVILAHGGDEFYQFRFCPNCGKKMGRPASRSIVKMQQLTHQTSDLENHMAGKLKIIGGKFNRHTPRWVVLNGKFLYIFKNREKEFPDTVFFIQGYFIRLQENEHGNYHLIKLIPPSGANARPANFYTSKIEEAKKWHEKLELAAQTVSIEKFYQMGESLGKGSFAEVRIASEKETGRKVAVKIIQKKVIDGKQKEYIRIEMSVMKLVNHPNVMALEQVFETKTKIFMVMPLYNGGDLYEYMKKNARKGLTEDKVRLIIWQVINALRYLHSVGIVHRDLKPENLLLKKEGVPTDIVITDFGLSKFAAPHEAMKAACGTLSYVAPEVLRMEGYGKEVDLWSTGVIMFLILRAKLPFYDTTKNRIIARILRQTPQMVDDKWNTISGEAKDFIKQLLIKQPQKRITCEQALHHPFLEPIRQDMIKKKQMKQSPNIKPLGDTISNPQAANSNSSMNSNMNSGQDIGIFPASRSVKDIKYGDVNGYSIKEERKMENRPETVHEHNTSGYPPAPATLIKQNSVVDRHNQTKFSESVSSDDDE